MNSTCNAGQALPKGRRRIVHFDMKVVILTEAHQSLPGDNVVTFGVLGTIEPLKLLLGARVAPLSPQERRTAGQVRAV